jgi:hypothetical protein
LRELKLGIDQKLPTGAFIKASDYLINDNPQANAEQRILFLECPHEKYFTHFIRQNSLINTTKFNLIIHMGSTHVLNSNAYMSWLKNVLSKNILHVFLDENEPNVCLGDIYEMQAQLNLLDPQMFPLLPMQRDTFRHRFDECKRNERELQKDVKLIQGKSEMVFKLSGGGGDLQLSLDKVAHIDNCAYRERIVKDYKNIENLRNMLDENEKNVLRIIEEKIVKKNGGDNIFNDRGDDDDDVNNNLEDVYPKVLFLGRLNFNIF